jgi:hypothetical protein
MLTRAAVFCGHQSVHTVAQSRQETLRSYSIRFWSGDNPVKGSDGQVRLVQQTGEGHSRSCFAVGVVDEIGESVPLRMGFKTALVAQTDCPHSEFTNLRMLVVVFSGHEVC